MKHLQALDLKEKKKKIERKEKEKRERKTDSPWMEVILEVGLLL